MRFSVIVHEVFSHRASYFLFNRGDQIHAQLPLQAPPIVDDDDDDGDDTR